VECQAGGHTVRVASSSHAPLMAGEFGPIHLLGTRGEFYFLVPADVREFAVRFWGSGDLERVSAAVCDATGAEVWQQATTGPNRLAPVSLFAFGRSSGDYCCGSKAGLLAGRRLASRQDAYQAGGMKRGFSTCRTGPSR
jgi:hypothetical protein